jgi:hypothetical protein
LLSLRSSLNPVIQSWIGANCSVEPESKYSDATTCLAGLWKGCSHVTDPSLPPQQRACTENITTTVQLDAAGLMVIRMDSDSYGGGAHDVSEVHALNLDLHGARALQLNDLLEHPNTETLALRITHALRQQRHIPADQPLTQAGFNTDHLPVPATVMIMPEGLLFTYQSYDIAAYSEGQPQVLVPFAELSDMVSGAGPLPRLRALLEVPK